MYMFVNRIPVAIFEFKPGVQIPLSNRRPFQGQVRIVSFPVPTRIACIRVITLQPQQSYEVAKLFETLAK